MNQSSDPGANTEIQQLLRYRWIIFAIVSLNGILLYFQYAWGATLSGYHSADGNLDARQLGLLAALGFFPYALMQVPTGYLTDLLGSRKLISVALIVLALGTAIFASAPNYAVALVGRTLMGLATGAVFLPSLKSLARWFRAREFASVQGVFILLANAGALLGTLPLAVAAENWGWRAPMLVVAGLTILIAAATWTLLRDEPTDLGLPPIGAIDSDSEPVGGVPRIAKPSLRTGFRAWHGIPTLWGISVIFFITFGALQAFQALWAGPLLRHIRGLSVTETGSALLMLTIGAGLGPALFGIISDRVVRARKPVVVFAALGQAALWTLLVLTIDTAPLPLVYISFVLLSALSGGVLVAQVIVKELTPPHLFGTVFGFHNGAGFYGTAAFQFLIGSILSAVGPIAVAAEPIYSAQAYKLALSPIIAFAVLAALLSFKLGETLGPRSIAWPARFS